MAEAFPSGIAASFATEPVVDIADVMQKLAEHQGCGTSSEGGKASCGSSDGPEDMPPEMRGKPVQATLDGDSVIMVCMT